VWGYDGGAGVGGGEAWARPAACRVARRGGPAPAMAAFPVPGRSSLWTVSCCWGGWLVLVRGVVACCAVVRLWRVVGWVGFLSDVIGGVESALWEGCYPALTLALTCEANRAS
jgi:hypothetical protein